MEKIYQITVSFMQMTDEEARKLYDFIFKYAVDITARIDATNILTPERVKYELEKTVNEGYIEYEKKYAKKSYGVRIAKNEFEGKIPTLEEYIKYNLEDFHGYGSVTDEDIEKIVKKYNEYFLKCYHGDIEKAKSNVLIPKWDEVIGVFFKLAYKKSGIIEYVAINLGPKTKKVFYDDGRYWYSVTIGNMRLMDDINFFSKDRLIASVTSDDNDYSLYLNKEQLEEFKKLGLEYDQYYF